MSTTVGHYRKHVFVCENRRTDGRACCAEGAAAIEEGAVKVLRDCLRAEGAHGKGNVRINRAGCFDRCAQGPVLVVYPEGVWYRYDSREDLQKIARSHLLDGEIVEALRLPDE